MNQNEGRAGLLASFGGVELCDVRGGPELVLVAAALDVPVSTVWHGRV